MVQISAKISKEDINALPLKAFEGPIRLINNDDAVSAAVEILKSETVLGFDTETKPAFKKGLSHPPALLQLATGEEVFIFQLLQLSNIDPVWEILASRDIVKAGVAIGDDIKKLRERQEFEPEGFVELANLAQDSGLINTGLRSLTALLLNFRISKGAQVSNWAKSELSESQIQYAATDAWVSRLLYRQFNTIELDVVPLAKTEEEVD